jgi:hypothetical protein
MPNAIKELLRRKLKERVLYMSELGVGVRGCWAFISFAVDADDIGLCIEHAVPGDCIHPRGNYDHMAHWRVQNEDAVQLLEPVYPYMNMFERNRFREWREYYESLQPTHGAAGRGSAEGSNLQPD